MISFIGSTANGSRVALSQTTLDETLISATGKMILTESTDPDSEEEEATVVAGDDMVSTSEDTPAIFADILENDGAPDGTPLFIIAADSISSMGGTVVVLGDQTLSYDPTADFNGNDSFRYMISDAEGNSAVATVAVSVTSVNDVPVANDDLSTLSTYEDEALITGNLLANDYDVDGDSLEVVAVSTTTAQGGSAVYMSDGVFTYTPAADFNGVDSFTYTVSDSNGGTDSAIVEIDVISIRDEPIANPDIALTNEDTSVTVGNPLLNDVDVDNDNLTLAFFDTTTAMNGTVSEAGGVLYYTPAGEFSGTDTFSYTVDDGTYQASATVTITVIPINDEPVAGGDSLTAIEDTLLITGNLLLNDSDIDSENLSIIDYDHVSNNGGSVTLTTNGSFHYMPAANYNGADSFSYLLSDGDGAVDTALVSLNVVSVNDLPTIEDVILTLPEDSIDFEIPGVLAGAQDIDEGQLSLIIDDGSTTKGGSFRVTAAAVYYSPAPDYNGEDSFTCALTDAQGGFVGFEVMITVEPVNDTPIAMDDLSLAITMEDVGTATGNVLANDTDVDGDSLSVISWEAVTSQGGIVESRGDGTFNYSPADNYFGTDNFTYNIGDGMGGFASATVTVVVQPVNDPPTLASLETSVAEDTDFTLTSAHLFPGASDPEDDLAVLTLDVDTTTSAGGTVTLETNGSYTYCPADDFNGTDYFTTRVNDTQGAIATATVTVTVTARNDIPVAGDDFVNAYEDRAILTGNLILNDLDVDFDELNIITYDTFTPNGGTVVYNGEGVFLYTPAANFDQTDSFTYTVSDGKGGESTAVVTVAVLAVSDVAITNSDFAAINEDGGSVTIPVLDNDLDGDGDILSIYSFSNPDFGGTVTQSGQQLVFTVTPDFFGEATFNYMVSEDSGASGSSTGTVTVTVHSINDTPQAVADPVSTDEDQSVVFNVLENDFDVDGDSLTVIGAPLSTTEGGALVYHGKGVFTYTPAADFSGSDSFSYTLVDEVGATSAPATVTLSVAGIDDAPVAMDDVVATDEDIPALFPVLANDNDPEGGALLILPPNPTTPAGGTVALSGDQISYTPAAHYHGQDLIRYTISDPSGKTDSASVAIIVNSVNDVPIAVADSATGPEDEPLLVPYVQLNDTDDDGDILTVLTADSYSTLGARVLNNGGGTFTYMPLSDYVGTDTFDYTITDGNLGFSTATVTVTTTAVNDPPVANPDVIATDEDTPITNYDLKLNDSDTEPGLLIVHSVDFLSAQGAVLILNAGLLSYTPPQNFFGEDSFNYVLMDSLGATATGSVTVYVRPLNDEPQALDVTLSTEQGEALAISIYATDADGDVLNFSAPTTTTHSGSVLNHGGGSFTYQPDLAYVGLDTFDVTVTDGRYGNTTSTVTINIAAAADTDSDGDGLSDYIETSYYLTSPAHADTDGDGLSDGEEVIELGYNPNESQHRFNPTVADLPQMAIKFASSPQISLIYTEGTSETTTQGTEDATSTTHSETKAISVSVEAGIQEGKFAGGVTVTGSHSWTDEQTAEHRQLYEESLSKEASFEEGLLSITVNISNDSDMAFTLSNLILSALVPNPELPGELLPIGNLTLSNIIYSSFPETTLGPGQSVEGWIFTTDMDLDTTKMLLKDSRSLIVQPSSYELTDALGRGFNHNLTEVNAKTATILIDPGFDRAIQTFRVATNRNYFVDPANYGVKVGDVFDEAVAYLGIPLTADATTITVSGDTITPANPVQSIDNLAIQSPAIDGQWKFATTADIDGVAFRDIKLHAGDILALVYCKDPDNDGLGEREERLWGTDTNLADTDGDGLSDYTEVFGWYREDYAAQSPVLPEYEWITYFSNPLLYDSDGDNVNDKLERDNVSATLAKRQASDPYLIDTDYDFYTDDVDTEPTISDAEYLVEGFFAMHYMRNVDTYEPFDNSYQRYDINLFWNIQDNTNVSNIFILRYDKTGATAPLPPTPPSDPSLFPTWKGGDEAQWVRIGSGDITKDYAAYGDTNVPMARDYAYYAYVQVNFYGTERIIFSEQIEVDFAYDLVRLAVSKVVTPAVDDESYLSNDNLELWGTCYGEGHVIGAEGGTKEMKDGSVWYLNWSRDVYMGRTPTSVAEFRFDMGDNDYEPTNDDDYATFYFSQTWDGASGWNKGSDIHYEDWTEGGRTSSFEIHYSVNYTP